MSRILYLSITGMAEPLGQSQALEYLEGLTQKNQITLFSFERSHDYAEFPSLQKRMEHRHIHWYPHKYSNQFGLLSTLWMLFTAFFHLLVIAYRFRPEIIHVRSFLPGLLGWAVAKLCGAKFLFDIRGFAVDEKVDSGRLKKKSLLYKVLCHLEGFLYQHCDHLVTLTHVSKNILCQEFSLPATKITVIPTCANKALFYPLPEVKRQQLREELGFSTIDKILIHTGTVSGWYDFDKEVALFSALYQKNQNFRFVVLNRGEHDKVRAIFSHHGVSEDVYRLFSAPLHEVAKWLNIANAALFFIKPSYAKQASAPTKFAENVACHLPSISNSGVGDMGYYMKHYAVGITINLHEFSQKCSEYVQEVCELLTAPVKKEDYDTLFNQYFDKILAVERYQAIYDVLIGQK